MKDVFCRLLSCALLTSLLLVVPAKAATPNWDATGAYVINVNYLGVDYPENLVLQQSYSSITGGSLALVGGGSPFTVSGGSVSGNTIVFDTFFNGNPSLQVRFIGNIAGDGSMAGDWFDLPGGFGRVGTWASTSGTAVAFTKDACKNGGWQFFVNPTFRNQGQCVSYFAQNK